jgi:Protein of unknown function (DUF1523).
MVDIAKEPRKKPGHRLRVFLDEKTKEVNIEGNKVGLEYLATVLVIYYGWRLEILSMFPNIIKIRVILADYKHFPWLNVISIPVYHGILLFFISISTENLTLPRWQAS